MLTGSGLADLPDSVRFQPLTAPESDISKRRDASIFTSEARCFFEEIEKVAVPILQSTHIQER
jgi:hypothetical protein